MNLSRPGAPDLFLTDLIQPMVRLKEGSQIIGVEGKILIHGDPENAVNYLDYDRSRAVWDRLPPGWTRPAREFPGSERLLPYPWYDEEVRPCRGPGGAPILIADAEWSPPAPATQEFILPPINPNSDGLNLPEGLHTVQLTFHNVGGLIKTLEVPLPLVQPVEAPEQISSTELLQVRRLTSVVTGVNLQLDASSYPLQQNASDPDLFELDLASLNLTFDEPEEGADDPVIMGKVAASAGNGAALTPHPASLDIVPPKTTTAVSIAIRDVNRASASAIQPSRLYEISVEIASQEKIARANIGIWYRDKLQKPQREQVGEVTSKEATNELSGSIWIFGSDLLKHYGGAGSSERRVSVVPETADGKQLPAQGDTALAPPKASEKSFEQALTDAIGAYVDQNLPYTWGGSKAADQLKRANEGKPEAEREGVDCSGFVVNVVDAALVDSGHKGLDEKVKRISH
jgi:hypothetical protein